MNKNDNVNKGRINVGLTKKEEYSKKNYFSWTKDLQNKERSEVPDDVHIDVSGVGDLRAVPGHLHGVGTHLPEVETSRGWHHWGGGEKHREREREREKVTPPLLTFINRKVFLFVRVFMSAV